MNDKQPPPRKKGLARLLAATRYSLIGLRDTYHSEEAFRLEVWTLLLAIPLAFWVGESAVEHILLLAAVVLVMIVELLNTGIEHVVDRTGAEYNDFSRRAKDAGSAAVFVSMVFGGLIWLLILFT